MINVLEYLENSTIAHPDKLCAKDENSSCTYIELLQDAQKLGVRLATLTETRRPIAVFMDKSVEALKTFMGILYAGCFYTLVDPSFPADRIHQILSVLDTNIVITRKEYLNCLTNSGYNNAIIDVDEILGNHTSDNICGDIDSSHCTIHDDKLIRIRQLATDTDPVYCNFTSGSTGVPKGVLVSHRSIIDFINIFTNTFNITGEDVIGNQAPFDFDVSVKDIYSTLAVGASMIIIPKSFFMFPNSVMDMLDDNNVTTLTWAVSALCLLNRLHGLKYKVPGHINKILFSGEVMPIKQLNAWRSYYPDALFVNLYGPTEITCNCTYYIIDREFSEDDKLPMGHAFPNERVFLLDDNNKEITSDMADTPGEICVSGTCLALGYFNNPDMTAKAFTPNPICSGYPEMIYHTGDLACYGEDGLLYFAGRKDFQIKHMGHRIELEEIEHVLNNVSIVEHACCFFDERRSKIVAYYVGSDDKKAILDEMKTRVPEYMVPNILRELDELPINKNGKTDRKKLRALYENK